MASWTTLLGRTNSLQMSSNLRVYCMVSLFLSFFFFYCRICPGVQLQRERSIIYSRALRPVSADPRLAARNSWDAELFTSAEERKTACGSRFLTPLHQPGGKGSANKKHTAKVVCTKGCDVTQHQSAILANERTHRRTSI